MNSVIGSIIGDINGSIYEFHNVNTKEFALFANNMHLTDDSVLTIATMSALMDSYGKDEQTILESFKKEYSDACAKRPRAGYGYHFAKWAKSRDKEPYGSLGNGSAMRVSPVAHIAKDMNECLYLAKLSSQVTHNHIEGIKGAQATAAAAYLALHNATKQEIKRYIADNFYPNIVDMTYSNLKKDWKFDVTCPGTVPQAITVFLESTSFEDCVRSAVYLGGDCDTLAAIACSVAGPYYKDKMCSMESIRKYLTDIDTLTITKFDNLVKMVGKSQAE